MTERTKNVQKFLNLNDKYKVVSGAAFEGGGGYYTLDNGQGFSFTLDEARSMPDGYPDWGFVDVPKYNAIDKSDEADAKRMRWLLNGNGYFMEENFLCGHEPVTDDEADRARAAIDAAMQA